jgi:DNA modification methylase
MILVGDALACLRAMPSDSVHCVVTSPPYWGLRDYGVPPRIWSSDPDCQHRWGSLSIRRKGSTNGRPDTHSTLVSVGASKTLAPGLDNDQTGTRQYQTDRSAFCSRCTAWRGVLGLEPDYRLYVDHLVAVLREVRRVLRPDGTLWLNLGDCYATGPTGQARGLKAHGKAGLKPKDLVGIPWRVAFALQDDG